MNATILPQLLTVQEVADVIRVRSETVRRLARAHKIPALKVSHKWLFEAQKVREWIAQGQPDKTEQPSLFE